jgi:hypothetical protein
VIEVGDVVVHRGNEARLMCVVSVSGPVAHCSWMEPGWGKQEAHIPLAELTWTSKRRTESGVTLHLVQEGGK